ncbi:hypothetical protein VIGAN_UM011300 [Vigna angularis var. angularis]|uniref:Uncharacterized protein n=1 Tax=Vigna angularis var. angularis TaxID=157739 RepID=A0A0S3TDA4_PHAAN|nr:hypothetical protein VIGAN_UM011300 [Vigna angularis var. angularis]
MCVVISPSNRDSLSSPSSLLHSQNKVAMSKSANRSKNQLLIHHPKTAFQSRNERLQSKCIKTVKPECCSSIL